MDLTIPKDRQARPGDKITFAHPLSGCREQRDHDTNWITDTMKEYLEKGDFYGSIKLNFQASRLVNINVDRSIVKPEKQGKGK